MPAMLGLAAAADESSPELFIALTDRYYAAILNYLYQLVHDRGLAEELTQDVFVKAFGRRDQLPEVGNQRAWLYRVATNLAIDASRRRRRFAWLPWQVVDSLRVHQPDPGEQVSERSAVEKALAAVPLGYRAPLLLRDQYGFSIPEIAQVLDVSENAVSTRLHRARQMFTDAYDQENGK